MPTLATLDPDFHAPVDTPVVAVTLALNLELNPT